MIEKEDFIKKMIELCNQDEPEEARGLPLDKAMYVMSAMVYEKILAQSISDDKLTRSKFIKSYIENLPSLRKISSMNKEAEDVYDNLVYPFLSNSAAPADRSSNIRYWIEIVGYEGDGSPIKGIKVGFLLGYYDTYFGRKYILTMGNITSCVVRHVDKVYETRDLACKALTK